MEDKENYTVEFSEHEINSLLESLTNLRKVYAEYGNALQNPLFVEACKLQHKIARVVNPDSTVTLDEYLDYGK
ncbi:MAG TPA: hypothetical protein VGC97_08675 [Pyrinomonadaceae bacterium]|jgi:hypothetical protein